MLSEWSERDREQASAMLEETARDLLWNTAWGLNVSRLDRSVAERMLLDARAWLVQTGDERAEALPALEGVASHQDLARALLRTAELLRS